MLKFTKHFISLKYGSNFPCISYSLYFVFSTQSRKLLYFCFMNSFFFILFYFHFLFFIKTFMNHLIKNLLYNCTVVYKVK